jgi:hypothetical protein
MSFYDDGLLIPSYIPVIFIYALALSIFCDDKNIMKWVNLSPFLVHAFTFLVWGMVIFFDPIEDGVTLGILFMLYILWQVGSLIIYPVFYFWSKYLFKLLYR